jgi:hypothetical protein
MKIHAAVVKEQGVTFAVVVVKNHVLYNDSDANQAIVNFSSVFPGMPVVLMAQDSGGTPEYYGRRDIVNFLSNVPMAAIPWREWSVN